MLIAYPTTKDLYPEQIKNSVNSAVRKQTFQLKMGKILEYFVKENTPMISKKQKCV